MNTQHPEKKPYTLNDIARELGVNKATVSKALSGKGNLSAETRARILEFIQKCGYKPNAAAQSLARNRSFNIGLMMPEQPALFDSSFFRSCLRGVCQVAGTRGYDVLMALDNEHSVENLSRLIGNRKIDGVIAMRALVNSPMEEYLKQEGMPFVLIGPTTDPAVDSVDNDNQAACRELTARLIAGGVKRMALLGGLENNCVTHSRLAGFLEACRSAGLEEGEQQVILNLCPDSPAAPPDPRLEAQLDQVLARKPECIVCMDDLICSMAMGHLRSRGIAVPQQIQVVSFYDSLLLEYNLPPVTSLRFDAESLGKIACQKLIDKLENLPEAAYVQPGHQLILRQSANL